MGQAWGRLGGQVSMNHEQKGPANTPMRKWEATVRASQSKCTGRLGPVGWNAPDDWGRPAEAAQAIGSAQLKRPKMRPAADETGFDGSRAEGPEGKKADEKMVRSPLREYVRRPMFELEDTLGGAGRTAAGHARKPWRYTQVIGERARGRHYKTYPETLAIMPGSLPGPDDITAACTQSPWR